jgi:Ni/Co efflux regulator RcnB
MKTPVLKRFSHLAIAGTALVFGATGIAAAHGPLPSGGTQPGDQYSHAVPQYQYKRHNQNNNSASAQHYQAGEIASQNLLKNSHRVTNPAAHNLARPPQGYYWIQTNNTGDYMLINQHSGRIAGIIS